MMPAWGRKATTMPDFDVVIIGAGVAGGALGTRLARDGLGALTLERTLIHVDRIRGEAMLPWGVHEAAQLAILDDLLAADGHYNTKLSRFDSAFRSRLTCRR